MKASDMILTTKHSFHWRAPRVRWTCVYGIPNGSHDGKVTYAAAVGRGFTKRGAIADARAKAEARR